MSLNDIELPGIVMSELYKKDVLISVKAAEEATAPPANQAPTPPETPVSNLPGPYRYLGNNRKNITILVNSPGMPFLPDDQLTFLTKMLEACKLNIGDVAIVNQATHPVTISMLKPQLSPSILLLFGPEPVDIQLPLHFPTFKLQAYDQCTYLSAPSLDQLGRSTEEGKLLKSKLWVCLKALFQL